MKHEDSGMRIKEEWIMDIVRVSAVLCTTCDFYETIFF